MNYPVISSPKNLTLTFAKDIPKYLTMDEVQHVLASVSDNPKKHLFISMLWQTGARVSELLEVCVKDIDFYARTIQLPTIKRRVKDAKRTLPLQDSLKGDIGAYIAMKSLKSNDQIFPFTRQTAYNIASAAVTGAGYEKDRAHPHVFRHSFAVHCILSSVPIVVLQQWLGHANIQNTLIYLQVLGRDTRHFFDGLVF
jgi:integrase